MCVPNTEKPALIAAIDAEAARLKTQLPATAVDVRDRFVVVVRNEAQAKNLPTEVVQYLTVALDTVPLPTGNVLDPAANIDALAAKAKSVIEAL